MSESNTASEGRREGNLGLARGMAGVGLTRVPSLERPGREGHPLPPQPHAVGPEGGVALVRPRGPDPSRPQVPQNWGTAPGSPRASGSSGETPRLGLALARRVVTIVLQEARARLAAQRSTNWGPA